jgi:hypothetical protein
MTELGRSVARQQRSRVDLQKPASEVAAHDPASYRTGTLEHRRDGSALLLA